MVRRTRAPRARRTRPKEADTCQQIADFILDYITGELHPDTASQFEEHMRICPDCVSFLNTYRKTVQITRSLRYEDIPGEMEKRVRQFLQKKIKSIPPKR